MATPTPPGTTEAAVQLTAGATAGLHLAYAVVAFGLVVFLARTLSRNGAVFLADVFADRRLSESVNQLLVTGFHLFNLGYAFLLYDLESSYPSTAAALNHLFTTIGTLLLSLGVIHLVNMVVFWRIRNHDRPRPQPASFASPTWAPPPAPRMPSAAHPR